ncbi:MAG: adenylosuccinate lyase [Acidimicrobiaceae bacterium]|nr:adenylosuccinate lyase [Acidimicrobiaceae bacterium]
MIERYSMPEMAEIFSDESKFRRYLEIELLATTAHGELGFVPRDDAQVCRERAPKVDAEFVLAVTERERVTDHDVAAFVDVVQQRVGMPAGAWIHHGLTSSDVVDTAWCWMLRDAATLIDRALVDFYEALVVLANKYRYTVMIGRTHGVHAEPTTFGAKVALWALQVRRDLERLTSATQRISVCKLSGAVGTYSNIDPRIEASVAKAIGLTPVPATQVIARDRHAEYLWACASIGTTIETIAVELRHLQRTEVNEVREGFSAGQKGSSAMPHKRNPISSETLTGLSRVLRANLQVGLQDVALWHERDISHSSAERIVLPDSSMLAYYMLRRASRLIANLEVDTEQMTRNLYLTRGVVFSQSVLLALVVSGMSRDIAYRLVQELSSRAITQAQDFRELLADDNRITLSVKQLDEAFDLNRCVKHTHRVFDALQSTQS